MRNIFLLISCVLPFAAAAQDVIVRTDGTKVEAKVQEVGIDEIRYRLFNNPEGPVYVVERDEVSVINYQNGTSDTLNVKRSKGRSGSNPDSLALNKHKSIISFNIFDMVYTNLSFSYERIFGKGYFGIKVPVSVGLGVRSNADIHENSNYNTARLWGTGLDINIYPAGQSRISYFVGPSVIIGAYKYGYYSYGRLAEHIYYPRTFHLKTGYHFAFVVNNGMMIQPTKHMNITIAGGLGMRQDLTEKPDYFKPKATLYTCFGYRF